MEICVLQNESSQTENDQYQGEKLEANKSFIEPEVKLNSIHNLEDQTDNIEGDPIPDVDEENSYHELRCLSNDDLNDSMTHFLPMDCKEYEELINMTQQQVFDHSYCKFYRSFSQNGITDSLENTDDQLFIKIVKEEIDLDPDLDDETSLFDSISFNIEDSEDSMTQIKIVNAENNYSVNEPSRYIFFKKPQDIPDIKKVVRRKEKRIRKPMGLQNYRSLITQAINSSPEKRMILTDIYKWITERVPFFKDKDDRGKNGWKNCIRHTLSVNERFMRVKNRENIRSSYWTVCEEGEFQTKLAAFPWVSEIFTPEERKRTSTKIKEMNLVGTNKNQTKIVANDKVQIVKKVINTKAVKAVKKTKACLKGTRDSESSKPRLKMMEKKKRILKNNDNRWHQVNNIESTRPKRQKKEIKSVSPSSSKIVTNKKHKTKKKVIKKANTKVLRSQRNIRSDNRQITNTRSKKAKKKNDAKTIRRSSRKKVSRKSWVL